MSRITADYEIYPVEKFENTSTKDFKVQNFTKKSFIKQKAPSEEAKRPALSDI